MRKNMCVPLLTSLWNCWLLYWLIGLYTLFVSDPELAGMSEKSKAFMCMLFPVQRQNIKFNMAAKQLAPNSTTVGVFTRTHLGTKGSTVKWSATKRQQPALQPLLPTVSRRQCYIKDELYACERFWLPKYFELCPACPWFSHHNLRQIACIWDALTFYFLRLVSWGIKVMQGKTVKVCIFQLIQAGFILVPLQCVNVHCTTLEKDSQLFFTTQHTVMHGMCVVVPWPLLYTVLGCTLQHIGLIY